MSHKGYIIVILALSFIAHFLYFGHPNETVFDEVHFGKFISAYYTHNYYYDIHPPLGKLIIAGFAYFFDFKPDFGFGEIGDKFPDNTYLALRFLPTLAGTLLPLVLYLVALRLGLSQRASFAVGLFIIFENALLTNSRLILMDAFLYLFGFLSLLFYLGYRRSNKNAYLNLFLFSLFAGFAASIKWTGLTFLALAGLFEIYYIIKAFGFRKIINLLAFFAFIPFAVYFSIFALHFSLLQKSGEGDAFMDIGFQKTLQGNMYYSDNSVIAYSLIDKFVDLNQQMYLGNKRLEATHPYSSKWYTWPFMTRTVYFWVNDLSRIYFIGNPIIWWSSTIAILMLTAGYATIKKERGFASSFILLGYLFNLLPFMGIGRVMFLYHYAIALIFAILALTQLIDNENPKKSKKILFILMVASIIMFIYFAPLNYGLPLTPSQFEDRIWFNSWL